MPAYGYIRKSVVHDATKMLSPEMQEAEIRRLAEFNHHDDIVVLSDLDISGTKDRTKRPGWDAVLTAIELGECKDLYSYSMSRLARSVDQLSAVRKLCTAHGVGLHLVREKVDTTSASGRLYWNLQSSFEEFWSDVTSERVRDAFAVKRANDPTWAGPGNRNYGAYEGEDVGAVVAAFKEARSFDGAARLLNERKVPCRSKHGRQVITTHKDGKPVVIRRSGDLRPPVWHGTSVAAIVRRDAPDEVAPASGRGARAGRQDSRLSRLLACGAPTEDGGVCGTFLTPSRDARTAVVRYYCHRGQVTPHPRGWVLETNLLPLVVTEMEHAALRIRRLQRGKPEDEAMLGALTAKRSRILENYDDGLYDKPTRDRRLGEVADAESKLSARRWVRRITLPPDIERGDPATVNGYLRRLLLKVTVDMSAKARRGPSQPTLGLTFEWRDESLRADEVPTV